MRHATDSAVIGVAEWFRVKMTSGSMGWAVMGLCATRGVVLD